MSVTTIPEPVVRALLGPAIAGAVAAVELADDRSTLLIQPRSMAWLLELIEMEASILQHVRAVARGVGVSSGIRRIRWGIPAEAEP